MPASCKISSPPPSGPRMTPSVVLSQEWVVSSMDTVVRLDGLWVVQWNNLVGTADYPKLMDHWACC